MKGIWQYMHNKIKDHAYVIYPVNNTLDNWGDVLRIKFIIKWLHKKILVDRILTPTNLPDYNYT